MKHFLRKLLVLLLLSPNPLIFAEGVAKWTIMVYAQADSVLNSFAARNFQAMTTVGSSKDLNIIVQWNQPKKSGIWRYKINKNQMELIDSAPQNASANFSQDLINFSEFVAKNYAAENYALVLWNHGLGIIDPKWGDIQNFAINPAMLNQNPRIQIPGITTDENTEFRSILFDVANRSYLTNQGLTYALSHITKNILQKKFALIGMDACLMSMLEVHYQIKDFAVLAVSSEEVELAQGWNYAPILLALTTNPLSTEELASHIVSTFEEFYQAKTKFYTQSAIKLDNISLVKESLDEIINNIIVCKKTNSRCINVAIKRARDACFQLSISCYVDLYSLYTELQKEFAALGSSPKLKSFVESSQFKDLQNSISVGMKLIESTIIANVASDHFCRAKGISIYYPQKTIDESYYQTVFCQESLWLPFLQQSMR